MKTNKFDKLYTKMLNEAPEDLETLNIIDIEDEPTIDVPENPDEIDVDVDVAGAEKDAEGEEEDEEGEEEENLIALTFQKEDFVEPSKFDEILDALNIKVEKESDEDEITVTVKCVKPAEPVEVEEQEGAGAGVGMGSAGYVEASVNTPGASNAIFVPFKGKYTLTPIARRIKPAKLAK